MKTCMISFADVSRFHFHLHTKSHFFLILLYTQKGEETSLHIDRKNTKYLELSLAIKYIFRF